MTTQVTGFRKRRWYTHENLGEEPLDLPPSELQTTGYWLSLSEETITRLREAGVWTNDPNDYGPDWGKIRDRVRARDKYTCQVCGAPETPSPEIGQGGPPLRSGNVNMMCVIKFHSKRFRPEKKQINSIISPRSAQPAITKWKRTSACAADSPGWRMCCRQSCAVILDVRCR